MSSKEKQRTVPRKRQSRPWLDRFDCWLMIGIGAFLLLIFGISPSCHLRDFPITDTEIIWRSSVSLVAVLMIFGSIWFLRWRK
ncbi:MAG: hypothetical protein ACI9C2_001900 [Gammaproteobacteria bacterium]|jgi:hypothetical protein